MAKPQRKISPKAGPPAKQVMPKVGMHVGAHGSGGVLDTSTLPPPSLPPWGGWKGIDRDA